MTISVCKCTQVCFCLFYPDSCGRRPADARCGTWWRWGQQARWSSSVCLSGCRCFFPCRQCTSERRNPSQTPHQTSSPSRAASEPLKHTNILRWVTFYMCPFKMNVHTGWYVAIKYKSLKKRWIPTCWQTLSQLYIVTVGLGPENSFTLKCIMMIRRNKWNILWKLMYFYSNNITHSYCWICLASVTRKQADKQNKYCSLYAD